MNQQDFKPFCNHLDLVAEQYNKTLSEGLKMLYFQGLQHYDFEAVKQAMVRHLQNPDNGMFMPKIADFVKMMQGNTQDSALLAWAKVDKAIRMIGTWESVVFDDPIIHRVLADMGGWLSLSDKQEEDWPFVAKEFENRYRGYKQRNDSVEYPPVMIGRYEKENFVNGHHSQEPLLIGNQEKAMQVLSNGSNKPSLEMASLSDVRLKLGNKKQEAI
jgi:hypothetical protein